MRRPCWHFLQAGHSLASMRHPSLAPTSPPLHPGPAVPSPEHLREVVDALEVLQLVGRLAGEQPDVDQQEDDAPQVLGVADVPVGEHRGGEQPELLQREVAARPCELRAGEVAPRRELRLRVLERRQHEYVAALGVTAVALADLLERFRERRELAHGRSPRGWSVWTGTTTGRDRRGSSNASSNTSSSVSTGLMSSSFFTSSGTSTRSLLLRAGTSTVCTPARAPAVSFPLSPPIGSTRPRTVRPPAIATSWREGRRHKSDASAAAIAIPADGPSFGTAPAGTCRCTSVCVNASSGIPSEPARARSRLQAACADSFITSPSCPV